MGSRSAAAREAARARTERMAAIAAREDEIERSLAGFLRARAEQEEVMDAARARCEAIMGRAVERVNGARVQADAHVVRLLELVGDRDEVAARTGLSQRELRRASRDAAIQPVEEGNLLVRADGGAGGAEQGGIQPCGSAAAPSTPGSVVTAPATGGGSDDGGVVDGQPERSDENRGETDAARPAPNAVEPGGPAG